VAFADAGGAEKEDGLATVEKAKLCQVTGSSGRSLSVNTQSGFEPHARLDRAMPFYSTSAASDATAVPHSAHSPFPLGLYPFTPLPLSPFSPNVHLFFHPAYIFALKPGSYSLRGACDRRSGSGPAATPGISVQPLQPSAFRLRFCRAAVAPVAIAAGLQTWNVTAYEIEAF
jgi:hypothetical protein